MESLRFSLGCLPRPHLRRKGTRAESVGVGYPPNGNVERHSRHSVQPISRALPNGAPRLVEKTQIQCRNAR
ncbi:Uncharacterised protein [Vibrio cholerae]|nr:Uncharacterised protein [Vibrio cholerae]